MPPKTGSAKKAAGTKAAPRTPTPETTCANTRAAKKLTTAATKKAVAKQQTSAAKKTIAKKTAKKPTKMIPAETVHTNKKSNAKTPTKSTKAAARFRSTVVPQQPLPIFKYHPNVLKTQGGTGVIIPNPTKVSCDACETVPSYIYQGPIYHTGADNPTLCPHCIASGAAAAKFKCTFGDVAFGSADKAAVKEAVERTPGFPYFNEQARPVHCSEPCALLGLAKRSDINEVQAQVKRSGQRVIDELFPDGEDDVAGMLEHCDPDGDIALIAYECVRCHKRQYKFDMS